MRLCSVRFLLLSVLQISAQKTMNSIIHSCRLILHLSAPGQYKTWCSPAWHDQVLTCCAMPWTVWHDGEQSLAEILCVSTLSFLSVFEPSALCLSGQLRLVACHSVECKECLQTWYHLYVWWSGHDWGEVRHHWHDTGYRVIGKLSGSLQIHEEWYSTLIDYSGMKVYDTFG